MFRVSHKVRLNQSESRCTEEGRLRTIGVALAFEVRTERASAYKIANLFGDEVLTSVKRSIDVLKPERQRLVLKKPWA